MWDWFWRREEPKKPDAPPQRVEIYDFRQSTMLHLFQAYRLMKEGGGSLEMKMASEQDVAFIIKFRATRPLIVVNGDGEILMKPGYSGTLNFTFRIFGEGRVPRPDVWKGRLE